MSLRDEIDPSVLTLTKLLKAKDIVDRIMQGKRDDGPVVDTTCIEIKGEIAAAEGKAKSAARLPVKQVASRIDAHLKRFESDPKINTKHGFWRAGTWQTGRYVMVCYVSSQGTSALSRSDAETYLRYLDAGNVGHHWKSIQEAASLSDRKEPTPNA